MAVLPGSTRASVVFFSNFGVAYTSRIIDIPASTGYGEPIQRFFKLKDGERIVAAVSLDPRVAGQIAPKKEGQAPPVHAVAVPSDGYSLRFSLEPFVEPSTRAGRRYAGRARRRSSSACRDDQRHGDPDCRDARGARHAVPGRGGELPVRSRPRRHPDQALSADDRVLGFIASTGDRDLLTVETSRGAEQTISTAKYEVTGRGGKGRELLQRGQFTRIVLPVPEAPETSAE